jgi:hypothetical protein
MEKTMESNKDAVKPSGAKDQPSEQAGREQSAPSTKIMPVDKKVGEAPGHLRAREDAFKRRHGKT